MKKLFITLFAALAFCTANSQTLHVALGTSHSNLDWTFLVLDGFKEKQYRKASVGYAANVGIEYLDRKLLSLSSDVYFYKSGGQYTEAEKNANFVFQAPSKVEITYLSLGTCLNINPLNDKFKLQFQLGPRVDFMVKGQKDAPLSWSDDGGGLAKINVGLTGGIGLYYQAGGNMTLGIKGLYLQRFIKLADLEPRLNGQFEYGGASATEQTVLLNLSAGFKLK